MPNRGLSSTEYTSFCNLLPKSDIIKQGLPYLEVATDYRLRKIRQLTKFSFMFSLYFFLYLIFAMTCKFRSVLQF